MAVRVAFYLVSIPSMIRFIAIFYVGNPNAHTNRANIRTNPNITKIDAKHNSNHQSIK